MAVRSVGDGVTVVHPASLRVEEAAARPVRGAKRSVRGAPAGGGAASFEIDAILAALSDQDVELVKRLEIGPAPAPRRTRGARGAPAAGAEGNVEVSVALAPNEDAVILVEQDGEYHWELPDGTTIGARRDVRSRGARAVPKPRTVTFRVTVGSMTSAAPRRRGARGGVRGIFRKAVAFVLKFVRNAVNDLVIKHLEKDVKPGLVHVTSTDPTKWMGLGESAQPAMPDDRPARVLLLVHGTFSSTLGSFSGLTHTEDGLASLQALLGQYDLILGFDHRTLSEMPEDNAAQILARLNRINWKQPPEIDAIAYSRGGLVLRTLLESTVIGSAFGGTFRRAIFIACTNGGTLLAEPENWGKLVDVYTNLAAAATRGLKLIPQTRAIADVLTVTIKGVGILVKYLASFIIDGGGVPGLSAMEPDGDVVTRLNAGARPTTVAREYLAITNDYEPSMADDDGSADQMPASFRMKLADGLVDRLMGEANDLVVNTAAMTTVGTAAFEGRVLSLGVNGRTIHTTYFRDPLVVSQLATWLEAEGADAAPRTRGMPSRKRGARTSGATATRTTAKLAARKPSARKPSARAGAKPPAGRSRGAKSPAVKRSPAKRGATKRSAVKRASTRRAASTKSH